MIALYILGSMWASMMRLTSSAIEIPRRLASRFKYALCGAVNEIICLIIEVTCAADAGKYSSELAIDRGMAQHESAKPSKVSSVIGSVPFVVAVSYIEVDRESPNHELSLQMIERFNFSHVSMMIPRGIRGMVPSVA